MLRLSDRYVDELSAQFRTLNFFAEHAGEIGRAHEHYLREVLSRFFPTKYSIGSGFVISNEQTSSQQDIIIYDQHEYPLLFKAGDCIVVDEDAVIVLLEVKTRLNSQHDFRDAYTKAANLYRSYNGRIFVGIFTWEGINLDTALSTIWDYIRQNPLDNFQYLPNAVYVRGKYLLSINLDGRRETPPLRLLKIDNSSEGKAFLALIVKMWDSRAQGFSKRPWWLTNWWRELPKLEQLVSWPSDLERIMLDSLNTH